MTVSIPPISPIISTNNQHERKYKDNKNYPHGNPANDGSNLDEVITSICLSLPISIAIDPLIQKTKEDMNILVGMDHYNSYN